MGSPKGSLSRTLPPRSDCPAIFMVRLERLVRPGVVEQRLFPLLSAYDGLDLVAARNHWPLVIISISRSARPRWRFAWNDRCSVPWNVVPLCHGIGFDAMTSDLRAGSKSSPWVQVATSRPIYFFVD